MESLVPKPQNNPKYNDDRAYNPKLKELVMNPYGLDVERDMRVGVWPIERVILVVVKVATG